MLKNDDLDASLTNLEKMAKDVFTNRRRDVIK